MPAYNRRLLLAVSLILGLLDRSWGLDLVASLSQRGVKGEIRFSGDDDGRVVVTADLNVAQGAEGEYTWGIYEFPIDYTKEDFCHSRFLGRRPRINLEELVGKLTLPSEAPISLEMKEVELIGPKSIWGTSLVLEGPSRERICATILPDVESESVKVAEARFSAPVAGSVFFHTLSLGDKIETKIFTNLYHVVSSTSSDHPWQIFITDILGTNKRRQTCNFLQILYDPDNRVSDNCSEDNPAGCKDGDLTAKFGKVRVGKQESMFTKKYYSDSKMSLPELGGSRSLYLTLYDADHPDSYLACAQILEIKPKVAKAQFMHDGITGHISLTQASPFHPVTIDVKLRGLHDGAGSFHIHEFPVPPRHELEDAPCGQTGPHFNPFSIDKSSSPPTGSGSVDQYEVGDLSGKFGDLKDREAVEGTFVDPSMCLFGRRSVVGRSIVIHKSPVPHRWVCANIEQENIGLMTAVATFTYPVGGRIIFRQEIDNPLADTMIYVEGLVYTDGTKNHTHDHRWHVHNQIPGKDYFNWTGRCLSAGGHFNPYRISEDEGVYKICESEKNPLRCWVGDLQHKHTNLNVAGKIIDLPSTKKFFTDSNLPLTGQASIVGHSIVLHDDHAPEHRGKRMACTAIRRQYRHKAVAREWFGNGIPPPVDGKLEFIQDTAMSTTHTLVDLHGLAGSAHSYHVHVIPVQPALEFPCTGDAVGGHFNPWDIDPTLRNQTSGTPDQFEVGDLSGKYGSLDERQSIKEVHNDTNLPMFGARSILGRSIVIHKKQRAERWACSTVGWGWDPDEARQVTAIASFHHPNGFAWGYIRFSQVVYNDGSQTDTVIQVRLKHPGKTNKDQTDGHDWAIWVNPVGHDAAIKPKIGRCTAAGYRWNPTFIQLADPRDHGFYSQQCNPKVPLRCEVGDMSGRHGKISVGGKAYVFNDVNLPLHGDWFHNAVGKSILIQDTDGRPLACANIEPDKDIIKYAVIKTLSGFNLAQFMEEVQAVMGVPDWFLFTDSRETKSLHEGKCLQILLHFRGPLANKLEQDFSRLLRTGKLDAPSITPPGYVRPQGSQKKLPYRECGTRSSFDRKQQAYEQSGYGDATAIKNSSVLFCVTLLTVLGLWSEHL